MKFGSSRRILAVVILVLSASAGVLISGSAAPVEDPAFLSVWERTDKPVADQAVARTWMWGPEAISETLTEEYAESPGGERTVQYFDKSRMEITDPDGDSSSAWYVTNGLLVVELMTGQVQTGNDSFNESAPAEINVAGDADDPGGPTYKTFASVQDQAPLESGSVIIQRIDRAGTQTDDPLLADLGITVAVVDDVTNHSIAEPFWAFMNSSGTIWQSGQLTNGPLFPDPYFATGRPIVEPSWAEVMIADEARLVLIQCFERRCLTYTPDNPPGWQVEAGNVGAHYYQWRYDGAPPPPAPDDDDGNAVEIPEWQDVDPPPPPSPEEYFNTIPAGEPLPSAQECLDRVRYHPWEPRPQNSYANYVTGTTIAEINGANPTGNSLYAPRVDGNFTGWTDEILQWGACKWGIDEDIVRGIATWQSWWWQWFSSEDGEAFGLMGVRKDVHAGTYPASANSTAFNVDYTLAWHRACFDGYFDWIPPEAQGDIWGCVGLWYSGNWKDAAALEYIGAVQLLINEQVWRGFEPESEDED